MEVVSRLVTRFYLALRTRNEKNNFSKVTDKPNEKNQREKKQEWDGLNDKG